ncbi:putative acetylxylan esterase 2 protein [Lasiodiplodia theobromae]|nr:putative acetylxylan esterase 2 protein [Lasiodiplodia theobromae]
MNTFTLPSSNISTVAVPYYDPAAVRFTDPSTYVAAVDAGIRDLRAKINDSIATCADGGGGAGIALLGYGRPGAQVVGDALCGRDGTAAGQSVNFGEVAPLNRAWGEKITAVVLMGDPGHIGGQTAWNVGTAMRDGIYPYRNVEQCRWYDGRVQSYCDRGDPMCDSGENVAVHLGLVEKYLQNATDFVVKKASQAQPS